MLFKEVNVWLLSDLHLEFYGYKLPPEGLAQADVLVLAGDIHNGKGALKLINIAIKAGIPCVYIPGNHELYGREYNESMIKYEEMEKNNPGLHFLQNKSVNIKGINFIGSTLWTNFNLHNESHSDTLARAKSEMNDYSSIYKKLVKSRPKRLQSSGLIDQDFIFDRHKESVAFIERELSQKQSEINFVATHHAPSFKSVNPMRHDNLLVNGYYASDLEWIMHKYAPVVWAHGHTHCSVDYMVGDSRVISNARGNPDDMKLTNFNPLKIIRIPLGKQNEKF